MKSNPSTSYRWKIMFWVSLLSQKQSAIVCSIVATWLHQWHSQVQLVGRTQSKCFKKVFNCFIRVYHSYYNYGNHRPSEHIGMQGINVACHGHVTVQAHIIPLAMPLDYATIHLVNQNKTAIFESVILCIKLHEF